MSKSMDPNETASSLYDSQKHSLKRPSEAFNKTPEKPKRKGKSAELRQLSKYGYEMTPPRYWDLDFPSLEEQKKLGLLVEAESPLFKSKKR